MTIEIRGMRPSDLSQVMRLLAHWNIAPMEPSAAVPVPERTELVIDHAYVALDGERIVGVCSYILRSPTLAEGASFGVDPTYHCRGIGEKLLMSMRRGMVSRGIRVVRSEADRPETIRWLVERMGCRIVGTTPKRHAFGSPGVGEWTVLEFDLARLSELAGRRAE